MLRRDELLKHNGFRVLRFLNDEIETALDFVLRRILAELANVGA